MFESTDDARKQILRDKHTLLEGYVSEYYFEQQFLRNKESGYTNGWWSAVRDNRRFFFLVKEKMNRVDEKVFMLLNRQYECWVAYPKGCEWFFFDGNRELKADGFLQNYGFNAIRNELAATEDTRNIERQNQCLSFFEKKEIIHKIAIERNFADDFLTTYFQSMVNIDFITENSAGILCVMEVKFKYENRAGNFGINAGQVQMFAILESIGFEIHHMILYNHTKDKDLSVFGFLELDADKYWLYGKLSGFSDRRACRAPKETSVDGRSMQTYYSFGMKELSRRYKLVIRRLKEIT